MNELFKTDVSLSPWEQWRREFDIHTHFSEDHDGEPWSAWIGDKNNPLMCYGTASEGETEADALVKLCLWNRVPSFDQWRINPNRLIAVITKNSIKEWRMKGGSNG